MTDFETAFDQLLFDDAVFTAFAGQAAITAEMLRSGAGVTQAADADDHLIYDTRTGALYYDVDGSGRADAVQVAVFTSTLVLMANHFEIG